MYPSFFCLGSHVAVFKPIASHPSRISCTIEIGPNLDVQVVEKRSEHQGGPGASDRPSPLGPGSLPYSDRVLVPCHLLLVARPVGKGTVNPAVA